jgi:hypothetical protein
VNKNNNLTKKEMKHYSSLINKRLLAMGLVDKIDFIASGREREFYKTLPSGLPELDPKTGKPITVMKMMPIARNTFRRNLKQLRNSPIEVIRAFLNAPLQGEKK